MSRLYLSPPDLGPVESQMVLEALESGWPAPVGPDLGRFEAEVAAWADVAAAVALASGSAALHLALLGVGVTPGDEVLASTFTFAATANAITYCGATPVFIDSESTTWNMSPELLTDELAERRRTNRLPAAVVVVDLYGQCADYTAIAPLCAELDIALVEDAAEATGAHHAGRPAGSFGQAGVFSFNGNKIITSGGGGMVVSDDIALVDRARYLSSQARQPVEHYEHAEVGYNYRLSNLLAALGAPSSAGCPASSSADAPSTPSTVRSSPTLPVSPSCPSCGSRTGTAGSPALRSTMPPYRHRFGRRWPTSTSKRARSGNRCTFSRRSTSTPAASTAPPSSCSSAASAYRRAAP